MYGHGEGAFPAQPSGPPLAAGRLPLTTLRSSPVAWSEGRLELDVQWDGRQVVAASVASTRPCSACGVFEGRLATEALAAVPHLFSVCARAQTVAARSALEAAAGTPQDPAQERERELLLAAECAHEHLWHLLLDLPPLLGMAPKAQALLPLRAPYEQATRTALARVARAGAAADHGAGGDDGWLALAGVLDELLARHVLGSRSADLLALASRADGQRWLRSAPAPVAHGLAALERAAADLSPADVSAPEGLAWPDHALLAGPLARAIAGDPGWAAAPTLDGAVREPGPRARQAAHPLLEARRDAGAGPALHLLARLLDLAAVAQRLRELAHDAAPPPWLRRASLGRGAGIAAVETARGTLVHRVQLDAAGERVVQWRSVAPTEWKFHPRGAWVLGMQGARARDEGALRLGARLQAQALDPCVAYGVRIRHA